MELQHLPDDTIFTILLNASNEDTVRLCRTNQRFRAICNDDYLWSQKLARNFPGVIVLEGESAKEVYKQQYGIFDVQLVQGTQVTLLTINKNNIPKPTGDVMRVIFDRDYNVIGLVSPKLKAKFLKQMKPAYLYDVQLPPEYMSSYNDFFQSWNVMWRTPPGQITPSALQNTYQMKDTIVNGLKAALGF